MTRTQFKTTTG